MRSKKDLLNSEKAHFLAEKACELLTFCNELSKKCRQGKKSLEKRHKTE